MKLSDRAKGTIKATSVVRGTSLTGRIVATHPPFNTPVVAPTDFNDIVSTETSTLVTRTPVPLPTSGRPSPVT